MIALGKVKPKPGLASTMRDEESDPDMSEDEDIPLDEEELAAAKLAFTAKSAEEYGKALKAFVQLCSDTYPHDEEE